jgi:putative transposase
MTVTAKVALVAGHREEYGLNACLRAVGLSKSVWYARQRGIWQNRKAADLRMKDWILSVIGDHPGYGYRRLCPELSERLGAPVNHKRVRRILRCYNLGLPRCLPASTPSRVLRVIAEAGKSADLTKGRSFAPMEAFCTDFTELAYAGGERKAWLMALLDINSRWMGGWSVAPQRHREMALEALSHLRRRVRKHDRDLTGVVIHHDRDSVYTSHAWLRQVLLEDRGRLSYAQRGARDNPQIESFWGRFKTENASLLWEAETLEEVVEIVGRQMVYYNRERRHSALHYQPPEEFLGRCLVEGISSATLADISR